MESPAFTFFVFDCAILSASDSYEENKKGYANGDRAETGG